MPEAFFVRRGDQYEATGLTRGPWHNDHQHGGPPAALLAGAMARFGDDAEAFSLARVTVELLRPVPIRAFELAVHVETSGRTVQRLRAELSVDGKVVVLARGLRIRRRALELPKPTLQGDWPEPESVERFIFPFFQHDVGYHQAVDLRVAKGAWGQVPVAFWARPLVPLVAGRETLPIERVMVIADAQSGMGVPLDPGEFTFVNPDLTVYFERPPIGEWLGFDIRSACHAHGVGLSQSAIRDAHGELGRSAQALVVNARG
ncbi:MAG: thioesterase family protein [Proteobacteria bacterium]|nr:thioesterase family protein [Pseudomonadota bacterium]